MSLYPNLTPGASLSVSPDARELGKRIGPGDKIRLTLVGYGTGSAFTAQTARNTVAQNYLSKALKMEAPTQFGRGVEFTIEGYPKTEFEPAVLVASASRDATAVHAKRGEALQYAPDDASVLMLDRAIEKQYSGKISGKGIDADGTVDWTGTLKEGGAEGLANTGKILGTVAGAAGSAAGEVGGGFFSGLGFVGTVVLISVVALILFMLILVR